MANYLKSGIDVSQWQGTIDWVKVKPQIDFALLRAGYGDTLSNPNQIDTQWTRNYNQCKKLGIPVGVYFYSYATTTKAAEREADSCIALLKDKQFEYPIYYDVEEMSIFKTGKTNEIIKAFCDKMEKAGYWVGIYIYRSAAQNYLNNTTKTKYSLAIAEYGSKCNYNGTYGVWQNSSKWRVNGINGNVDHDYCYVDYPNKIKAKGKNGYKATTVTTPTVKPTTPTTTKKTVTEVAKEVLAGKWGAGQDRKNRLTKAGYNYQEVQKKVNQLLKANTKKSIDTIAREVIAGKWGIGQDRINKLTKAGYNYQEVQKKVNQLLG